MAASLTMAARSAPTRPGVASAMGLRTASRSKSGSRLTFAAWTLRMSNLPLASGGSICTMRSKRPGRMRAASRIRRRFVAARTTTPGARRTPSIHARSWFRVCSCSVSLARNESAPRARPKASSSSMKMMHLPSLAARAKSWRTRAAPRPENTSTNSEPDVYRKGTFASKAKARARRVFPVPGGPTKRTPLGARAPTWAYFSAFDTRSLKSSTCRFASPSIPATSSKVTKPGGRLC
mmetsp:Transcript_1640/g.5631  ORF Transcript_1640/g.5631 Transcript_1640/m.5631 type:complete len:236 (-) Transcript_1640:406-1113(-)